MPSFASSQTSPDPRLWVTILAGGSGTRFWPVSTPACPKQLLPLAGPNSLIRDTLDRARRLGPDERIRILAGRHLVPALRAELVDLAEECYMVEPVAKGTGPVLAWAAWALTSRDPDAVMVSLHADHAIRPADTFKRLVEWGAGVAQRSERLLTIAVPPDRPEPGFGYIRPGDLLEEDGNHKAFLVRSFVEKPDTETARAYVEKGFLWNSGIFLWKASVFLDQLRAVAPELAGPLPYLERGDVEGYFREAPTISVDEAVLERSPRVATLRATFQWDDVGSWEALRRTRGTDRKGNVLVGSIYTKDSRETIAYAKDGEIVLFGVENLVVVRSGEITLVADRSRSAELKALLADLPSPLRDPDSR